MSDFLSFSFLFVIQRNLATLEAKYRIIHPLYFDSSENGRFGVAPDRGHCSSAHIMQSPSKLEIVKATLVCSNPNVLLVKHQGKG